MEKNYKFRAWDGKRMTTSGIMFNASTGCLEVPTQASFGGVLTTPYKLMQYTGLKDRNGNLIFEGDIISYDMHYASGGLINLTVKWDNNNCFYRGYFDEGAGHALNNFASSHYEILGNIYETPELLQTN